VFKCQFCKKEIGQEAALCSQCWEIHGKKMMVREVLIVMGYIFVCCLLPLLLLYGPLIIEAIRFFFLSSPPWPYG